MVEGYSSPMLFAALKNELMSKIERLKKRNKEG